MRPAISIDFGAAYTKIALRREPDSTTQLLTHEKLRLDEGHVCIPTIAAWREADDRWIFGGDAVDIQPGEGVHVFRNWKPVLFAPPGKILDPQSSIGRLFYYNLQDGESENWPPIKKLAVKYFEWLLDVMLPVLIDFSNLKDPVLRISIPDFSEDDSLYSYQMQEILLEAGWESPYVFCEPEPMTNIAGALSQGKNAVSANASGTVTPDVNQIFSGSGMIDYIELASGDDEAPGFTMLLADIGAYTTDFAMITIDGGAEGGLPPSEAHSVPFGIEMLDNLVKHGLPVEKTEIIEKLSSTDREAFRRTVYSEGRSWSFNNVTIGEPEDRQIVEKCINGMATRISNEIVNFMDQFAVSKINEVVITGGGSNIPGITRRIVERLSGRGVETFHAATPVDAGPAKSILLNQQVVRGSSAIGGASVLFGDE
ncbi:MAG: hypothetical protein P1V20_28235 [Verrucomicrobiales bacterium]|nr:hypothetical protein [Verrucomicrobiales bacterium]